MSRTSSLTLKSPPILRRFGIAVAVATIASGATAPAFADSRPWAVPPATSSSPADITAKAGGGDGPVNLARAKAKKSGKPVTVDELTTATSLTVANTDGSLTRTDSHQQARVRKNGGWAPVDASLVKNADGSYSPKATPSGVTLSGGGTGPLATFTDPDGRSLSLSLPFALPTPTVNGDGAQYPAVLPGVDLQVTVTDQGAFREVLVVHDAKAAANPALKKLRLATKSHGLTTTADRDGNITAKAEDGHAVFNAPAPVMWDSAGSGSQPGGAGKAAAAPQSAPAAGTAKPAGEGSAATTDGAMIDAADGTTSSAKGPGRTAHLAPVAVNADSDGITLTPDAGQLSGDDTAWPVYIDPYVNPVTGITNHYAEVKSGCPSQSTFDTPQTNGEGIGYQQYSSSCYGMYRSFFEFDLSNLNGRMVISKSEMDLTETYGADKACEHTLPVTLQLTGPISSNGAAIPGSTVWPGPSVNYDIATATPNSSNIEKGCGNHPVVFDITNTVRDWQTNGSLTFGLKGDESTSSTNYGFMRFTQNPSIVTQFDIAPNVPDQLGTTPAPQNPADPACGGGTPGWIGNSGSTNGMSNITLNARLTTDMAGVNMVAGYHVWDNMTSAANGAPAGMSAPVSPWTASGSSAYTNVGFQVADGHQYGWNTWAYDGSLNSSGSPYCYFNVDLSAPTTPKVAASTVFPPVGTTASTGHAGDQATVHVTANDITPTGCTRLVCISSGMSGFQYSLDSTGGGTTVSVTPDANGNAAADIPITVSKAGWGTHTLYVRSVDRAGNVQATAATYTFFAPANLAAKVTEGDVNGDGVPDLLATTSDGDLTLIPGNADPAAKPIISSTRAQSPEGDGWNNYLVTHRGSVVQQPYYDDLFTYNKNSRLLRVYVNDSAYGANRSGTYSDRIGHTMLVGDSGSGCAGGSDGTWKNVSQILATGSLANPATGVTNLITVEGGKLYFYRGTPAGSCVLDKGVLLGTGDWSGFTLIAPGSVGATITNGTSTGGTPTLWARDKLTGAVSSFPLNVNFSSDAGGNVVTTVGSIAAPTRSALVSGILDTSGKNMCLDIQGGYTYNGAHAQMWNCLGVASQTFSLGDDGTIHVLGKCLDISGSGRLINTPVQLWDCNGGGGQKWTVGPNPGSLQSPDSGLCLDDPGLSQTPGTQLIIYTCSGSVSQNWSALNTGSALPSANTVLSLALDSAAYPGIASPGDVDGDGNPDLYAVSATGQITRYGGAQPVTAAPTDRWKLADATDALGANGLTLASGAAFADDAARGKVMTLNGTTSYATSTRSAVDTSKSYTVSAWVKTPDLNHQSVFVSQSGTNGNGLQLYYSTVGKRWGFGRSVSDDAGSAWALVAGPLTGPGAPQANTWTHLTGVFDASNKQFLLYVNGAPAGTAAYSGTLWNATGHLEVGRRLANGGTYNQFGLGSVSDVQVYSSALSPAAVRSAMAETASFTAPVVLGTVAQPADRWKLTDATDSLNAANNLAITGGSFVTDTTRGKVLSLPGNSTATAATPGKVLSTDRSYSVSAWVYLTNTNSWSTAVAQSGSNVSSFYLQYNKSFNAWGFVAPSNDSANPSGWVGAYSSSPPALNKWTLLTGTYDATTHTMSLYVDGIPAGTSTNNSAWASNGPLTIGFARTGDYFPGNISDVEVWNGALSPAAVAGLINNPPTTTQLS